ncbi:MAG: electron transfer flavoprotein subunit beta/FixA family protein [Aromatoleum sp.]|jgi:electron transfer flavoprotein beta subunit|uniref:electron transfer flavoprotein subunit beta/FixA family protein n=1 Tax=Aromatoleum sp. TaxID=2307007 RepID=UPI0028953756|nr:electron transfer flavoprotein subunit beta/FixA family protein [Aromatoleum sp.]MDT3671834.1 electron transfer flavoprotein subunit beta/FixA family protein [Aromatoleum sp.]
MSRALDSMPMHIVVCIKQVPDSAQIRVHPVTNTIMRQGVPAIINPYDLFALEQALRIKDSADARVTVLSMGPFQAEEALKKCLSYGADDAILVTDKSFAGADTLATTYALAAAIRQLDRQHPVDIVFTGKQTIDGDTAQVGPGIAVRLGWQLLTYVSRLREFDAAAKTITVERRAEGGVQVLESRLPCVITMLEDTNEMRFADMAGMFRAERYEVPRWDRSAAGIEDVSRIGLKGSPTVVAQVFAPKPKDVRAVTIEGETPRDKADRLLDRLFADNPALEATLLDHLETVETAK